MRPNKSRDFFYADQQVDIVLRAVENHPSDDINVVASLGPQPPEMVLRRVVSESLDRGTFYVGAFEEWSDHMAPERMLGFSFDVRDARKLPAAEYESLLRACFDQCSEYASAFHEDFVKKFDGHPAVIVNGAKGGGISPNFPKSLTDDYEESREPLTLLSVIGRTAMLRVCARTAYSKMRGTKVKFATAAFFTAPNAFSGEDVYAVWRKGGVEALVLLWLGLDHFSRTLYSTGERKPGARFARSLFESY